MFFAKILGFTGNYKRGSIYNFFLVCFTQDGYNGLCCFSRRPPLYNSPAYLLFLCIPYQFSPCTTRICNGDLEIKIIKKNQKIAKLKKVNTTYFFSLTDSTIQVTITWKKIKYFSLDIKVQMYLLVIKSKSHTKP